MGALLVCRDCGSTTVKAKTVTKGSFALSPVAETAIELST
jgi:hypothetical protein